MPRFLLLHSICAMDSRGELAQLSAIPDRGPPPACRGGYRIVSGYEDAKDADPRRHDPAFQLLADQPLRQTLRAQPTLKICPREFHFAPDRGSMPSSVSAENRPGNAAHSARRRFHQQSLLGTTTSNTLQGTYNPLMITCP